MDKVYTVREVADLIRVDHRTVSRWCRLGLLKSYRTPGGHYRIRDEDVIGSFREDNSKTGAQTRAVTERS